MAYKGMLAKPFYFFTSAFLIFFYCSEYSKTTADQLDEINIMKDIGKRIPDKCFTSPRLEEIFIRACDKTLNDAGRCSFAWSAFNFAFRYKDPKTVTKDDYNLFFNILPVESPLYSAVFWSGVRNVVDEISSHPKISSSANRVSSSIINTMATDDNVMCWCGNETEILDTVNACPITPVVAFWQAFSTYFAESGIGIVYWIVDGNREGSAYRNATLFADHEFPNLIYPKVYKLVVLVIRECNQTVIEGCGEGTLISLEEEAKKRYGVNKGYRCENICGNSSDELQTSSLAHHCLQIIKEEQSGGN